MSRLAFLVTATLAFSGCFSVDKVDPGAYYLDTFEDENLTPRAPGFELWDCRTFVAGAPDGGAPAGLDDGTGATCTVQPVGDHPAALATQFVLHEPMDQVKETVGAEVSTHTTDGHTADLSGFRLMVFSALLDSGNPPLPANTRLAVEIGCRSARGGGAISQPVSNVDIGGDWFTFSLALADFLPPDPSCLQQVEAIRISVRPGLMDGLSAAGTLDLDDIYFLR
jgi:hypothetical protein